MWYKALAVFDRAHYDTLSYTAIYSSLSSTCDGLVARRGKGEDGGGVGGLQGRQLGLHDGLGSPARLWAGGQLAGVGGLAGDAAQKPLLGDLRRGGRRSGQGVPARSGHIRPQHSQACVHIQHDGQHKVARGCFEREEQGTLLPARAPGSPATPCTLAPETPQGPAPASAPFPRLLDTQACGLVGSQQSDRHVAGTQTYQS
jgi:hypothetical protein